MNIHSQTQADTTHRVTHEAREMMVRQFCKAIGETVPHFYTYSDDKAEFARQEAAGDPDLYKHYSGELSDLLPTLMADNDAGRAVSFVPREFRTLYVDIDRPGQTFQRSAIPPHLDFPTPGGIWGLWLLHDPLSPEEWEVQQRSLAEGFGGDDSVAEVEWINGVARPRRGIRCPGFYHQKLQPSKDRDGKQRMVNMPMALFGETDLALERIKRSFSHAMRNGINRLLADAKREIAAPVAGGNGDLAEVEELLQYITARGHYDLKKIGFALEQEFGEAAEPIWQDWRQNASISESTNIEWASWDNCNSGISLIYYLAKQNGANVSEIMSQHRAGGGGDLSHNDLATELGARGWDQDAKFVSQLGHWKFWDGAAWHEDDKMAWMSKVRAFVSDKAREILAAAEARGEKLSAKEAGDLRAKAKARGKLLKDAPTINAVGALARSNPASSASPDDFDAALHLLGTPGGTVDLRTGITRPAQRGDMISKLAGATPAPPGSVPVRWLEFLSTIFAGDQTMINLMQCLSGYALTGETREEKLFFLHGTGQNGKSKFLDALQEISGDYGTNAPAALFLRSKNEQHPTALAGLRGARLVTASELPSGAVWDEQLIKSITGGDMITARLMRQDFFNYKPQATIIIAGNSEPHIMTIDPAMRRRMVLIKFGVTIPMDQRDERLSEKLRAEYPAILRWMIDGAVRYYREGLVIPPCVVDASSDYLDREDQVLQFIEERCVKNVAGFVPSAGLLAAFNGWMVEQGQKPWGAKALTQRLKINGYEVGKHKHERGVFGLELAL